MFADGSEWELGNEAGTVCDSCGVEPGTVHIIRVEDGEFAHTHLCQTCAEEAAGGSGGAEIFFAVPTAIAGLLGNLLGKSGRARPLSESTLMCSVCGSTMADVEERGMLGCPSCYGVFAGHIEAALSSADGDRHLGKEPRGVSPSKGERREILRLERMLEELVLDERFEEAAGVRDRLAELSDRLGEPRS